MSGMRYLYWCITVAVLLSGIAGLILARQIGNPAPIFLPCAIVGLAVLVPRIFTDPVSVIAILLLVIVNFDYFKVIGSLTLDVVISSVLLWALLVRNGLERRRVRIRLPVEKLLLIFILLGFVSLCLSVSPLQSIKRWGRDFEFFFIFIFMLSVPLSVAHYRRLTAATIISSVLPCLIGLAGLIFGIDELLGRETPISGTVMVPRIKSTLAHPVLFSMYLGVTSTITLSFLLNGRFFKRFWLLPIFILQIVVLYLTYGRSGWGIFLIGSVALFWMRGNRWILLLGAPVVVVAVIMFLPDFIDRWSMALATNTGANSMLFRITLWLEALSRFPERPLFGSGPGTFVEYINFRGGFAPHQLWIGVLIENGAIGLAAFLAFLGTMFGTLWRRYRLFPPGTDPLLEGVFAVWLGLLGASFTEHVFAVPMFGIYLWVLTAIAIRSDSVFHPPLTADHGGGAN